MQTLLLISYQGSSLSRNLNICDEMHDLHLIEDLAYQPDPIFNLLNTNLSGTSRKPLSIYLGWRQLSQEDICGLNIYLANWSPQLIPGFSERFETKHLFKNVNLKFLFSPHSHHILYLSSVQIQNIGDYKLMV